MERLQSRVLKLIYGFDKSYTDLLAVSGLEDLEARRMNATDKFAARAADSERFSCWFARNLNRSSDRIGKKYHEKRRKLERTRINPIDYMTRRLNELAL
jgi:hypothetical protein